MTDGFIAVIPARYASTRLPGKPLKDIAGKPMIQWVYDQAAQSGAAEVIVATDDARIAAACGLRPFIGQPLGITHRRVPREVTSITSTRPSARCRYGKAAYWMPGDSPFLFEPAMTPV